MYKLLLLNKDTWYFVNFVQIIITIKCDLKKWICIGMSNI